MRKFDDSAVTKIQAILCAAVIIVSSIAIITYGFWNLSVISAPFSLNVITRPASFGDAVYAVPNEKCLFLVTVEENQTDAQSKAVSISATSPNCEVTVFPQSIMSGQVAEVTAVPVDADVGKNVTLSISHRGRR
jgi:hypothetical protein